MTDTFVYQTGISSTSSSAIQDESTGISSTLVQDRQELSRKRGRQQSLIDEESDEEIDESTGISPTSSSAIQDESTGISSTLVQDTLPSSEIQDESTGISSTLVQDLQELSRKRREELEYEVC